MTTPAPLTVGSVPLTPLALGAMIMGTSTPEDESRRILEHFVSDVTPRYRATDGTPARAMIDTADCYCWWEKPGEVGGHSESLLGRWLADSGLRDQVYLATKGTAMIDDISAVWDGDQQADWSVVSQHFVGASAPVLERSLTGSLERLGLDSVDLYYIHVDDRSVPLEETLSTLAGFVEDGRIGAYGWSNVRSWRLGMIRALCEQHGWPQPAALQQQHSYLRRRAGLRHGSIVDDEQLDYLEAHPDLPLVAYSPILKGIYNSAAKREGHWAMEPYAGPDADVRLDTAQRVADRLGCTPNQLVLAWLRHGEAVRVLPLIGPRTWDQYLEAVESLDVTLSDQDIAELDQAGA